LSRVDFYILPDVDRTARRRFASRLAWRALREGLQVHVQVDDSRAADEVDLLFWEYPPESFLPHAKAGSPQEGTAPVTIGCAERIPEPAPAGLLINLSARIPAFAAHFERVAEIFVGPDRAEGRERYRRYRDDGHRLEHHTLDDWES
jgi:DNA polymerase-3 subunit chi